MSIADWPADDRPREKLLLRGATALSDAELLAIFLRVGVTGKSAVDLARDLLVRFGSLTALFAAPVNELASVHGMGEAKYAQLQAVMEMSRRALGETLREADAMTSPTTVRNYLRLWLGRERREVFAAMFLDHQHRVIAAETLFLGTLAQATVHPREVVKRALALNAAALIIAHNHPSGHAEPSAADIALTDRLSRALGLVDVRILDHFVVAAGETVSLAERGWVAPSDIS